MAIVLADVGADAILTAFFRATTLQLRLFINDYTPLQTSTNASFTEAAGGGYALKTLTATLWTITPANDPSDAVYPIQTWTFTGELTATATAYGYFITKTDGTLIYAERFATAFTPTANARLSVTPTFQLSSGTPA